MTDSALDTAGMQDYLIEGAGRSLTWGGRLIWKNPLDLMMYAEIVAEVRPSLIVETGTHEGGSALFWADLLTLQGGGQVVSVDINHCDLEDARVTLLAGHSTSSEILRSIYAIAAGQDVLVNLDSDHSYPHVLAELEAYSPLVSPGSYLICEDGVDEIRFERKGVLSATRRFLSEHPEFEADRSRERLGLTNCPEGFLRRR